MDDFRSISKEPRIHRDWNPARSRTAVLPPAPKDSRRKCSSPRPYCLLREHFILHQTPSPYALSTKKRLLTKGEAFYSVVVGAHRIHRGALCQFDGDGHDDDDEHCHHARADKDVSLLLTAAHLPTTKIAF